MKIFQADLQSVSGGYLAGLIDETNFEKDSRPWKNFKVYRPKIEYPGKTIYR